MTAEPVDHDAVDARAYGPLSVDGPSAAERIWRAASREIGSAGLTRAQAGAVLHALADYTLTQRMLGSAVADLARCPLAYEEDPQPAEPAAGLARYFHGLADRVSRPEVYGGFREDPAGRPLVVGGGVSVYEGMGESSLGVLVRIVADSALIRFDGATEPLGVRREPHDAVANLTSVFAVADLAAARAADDARMRPGYGRIEAVLAEEER